MKANLIHIEKCVEYYENHSLIFPAIETKLKYDIFGLPDNIEKKEEIFKTIIDEFKGKTKKEIQIKIDENIKNNKYNYIDCNPILIIEYTK